MHDTDTRRASEPAKNLNDGNTGTRRETGLMTNTEKKRHTWVAAVVALLLVGLAACGQVISNPPPPSGSQPPPPPSAPAPAPRLVEAAYVSAAECASRTGNNGGQGFIDIGLNQCYACPSGYGRTIFDVRGNNACERGGPPPFGTWVRAEPLGPPGCTGNSFQVGSACYQCPPGSVRDPSVGRTTCRRG